jgi:hypothetical protein
LISPEPSRAGIEDPRTSTPPGHALVAWLLAAFAMLAAGYAIGIAGSLLPFNSGSWVVGEEVAIRGWLAYMLSALAHLAAAVGLWRRSPWARWLAIVLLALGVLPAISGISAAVVDLRIAGIALWGTLVVLRTAALYLLMRRL